MIKVLDSFVADKIAAGEVIERPVSAVKELIENSIDAGSDSIIVEIRGGGKSYIRVTDNGCGIAFDEAETAFLRHATSKISAVTDLDSISTLGFRGEALASISAVSRLTMVSRTHDAGSGIKLVIHGGKVISSERTGANPGTSMIAEDLFYNTPARRKFMKSDAREASAVIELVQQYAICYADIRFMMVNSGQTVFATSGDGDVLSVLSSLYPDLGGDRLIPLGEGRVRGFVSDPGNTRSNRKGQLFFVNGRLVTSPVIEKGLEDGYSGRIFSGFPAAILFIDADPQEIDVNIHPGKREIRFLKQDELRQSVAEAVNRAVMTEAGIPDGSIRDDNAVYAESIAADPCSGKEVSSDESPLAAEVNEQTSIRDYLSSLDRPSRDADTYNASTPPAAGSTADHSEAADAAYKAFSSADNAEKLKNKIRPFDFEELDLKGYVFDTYIIMQGRDSLYIFDQHAAHERIFYERFMAGYSNKSHLPQPILTAFTINVSADVYYMERGWIEDLRSMGYDIEDFGDKSFMVRGIPPYMSLDEAEGFIREYADAVSDTASAASSGNTVVIDKLIMRSCKSAVKANDRLSEQEIRDLMEKLSSCDNPYSCPHGRPTFIRLTENEIERSFKRK